MTAVIVARATLDLLVWIVRRRVRSNVGAIRLHGLGRRRPAGRHAYGRPGLVRIRITTPPGTHRAANVYSVRTVLAFAQARTPKGAIA